MGGDPPLLAAPSASSIWDRTREYASLGRRRTPSGFSLLSGARCPSGQLLLLVRAMHGSLLAWSGGNSTEPREAKPQTKSVVLTWLLFIGPRPSPGTTATPVPTGAACRLFALTTWRPADSGGYMARRMAGRTLWVRLPTRVGADMEERSSRRYFGEFDAFDGPATASVRRMLRVRITERPESGETSVRSGHFAICLFDGGRTSGFSSRTSRRKTTAFLVRWVRITVVGLPGCPHFPHCLLSCPLGDLPECLRIRA